MHETLRDLFWQGSYAEFFAEAEKVGIPRVLLETIAEAKAPEYVERYRGGAVEEFVLPQVKPFLDALWVVYRPVANRMEVEAARLHPNQHGRLQLLGHAADYYALAGEYNDLRRVIKRVLEDWPPDKFVESLQHPLVGHDAAWIWLFRITYYMHYLTDDGAGIRSYQNEAARAYSHWVKLSAAGDGQIDPEITLQEPFGRALAEICRDPDIRAVVEIGAGSGEGSTAVLRGSLGDHVTIYSFEANQQRFEQLQRVVEGDERCVPILGAVQPNLPSDSEVEQFLIDNPDNPLARYGKERVLGWLRADRDLLARTPTDGAGRVPAPDLLVVDGSEFTGWLDVQAFLERSRPKYVALDDTQTYKNNETVREIERFGYEVVAADPTVRHGYAIYRYKGETNLPIHFFTIVLDGQPYIEEHYAVFKELDTHGIPWRWTVVEGVAALRHDTGWSLSNGGRIPDQYKGGHSLDGTVQYLRDLSWRDPRVHIIQKPDGAYWDGKIQMVRAAQPDYLCLLWQVDADEIWTTEQIVKTHELFSRDPQLQSAQFYCDYYVGPDLVLDNRGVWGNNPAQEWWRVWRWDPAICRWEKHEPPVVTWHGQTATKYLDCDATAELDLVFEHFAYATRTQIQFKEAYYGYHGATAAWERLQQAEKPCRLQDYFPWAYGDPVVRQINLRSSSRIVVEQPLHLFVDGVFFQFWQTGIATVWRNLLRELPKHGIRISFYDRGGADDLPTGIERIPGYQFSYADPSNSVLESAFRESRADVFMSTYYTHLPQGSPQVLLIHDMIPEALGWDLRDPMWVQKHAAIEVASNLVAVSHNSAKDLTRYSQRQAVVAYPGVDANLFKPDPSAQPQHWLLIGCTQNTYKGHELFFEAYKQWPDRPWPVLCTFGHPVPPEYRQAIAPAAVLSEQMDVRDLVRAYQSALALVYTSQYEGFGLPILEAQACGIPVIAYRNSSTVEAGGDAVFYVEGSLASTMARVLDPVARAAHIARGLARANEFTWERMAKTIAEVLCQTKSN